MINSTSWFYGKDKVGKLEMAYTIGILCFWFIGPFVGYEGAIKRDFGYMATYASMPFCVFLAQYVIYGMSGIKADKELQDHFWKTQLWRFLDPGYDFQKSLYPKPKERLKELREDWEYEYDKTPEETKLSAPFTQKGMVVVYTGFIGIIVLTVLSYGVTKIFL